MQLSGKVYYTFSKQTTAFQAEDLDFYAQFSTYARQKYSSTRSSKDVLNISIETTYEGLTGLDKDYYIS